MQNKVTRLYPRAKIHLPVVLSLEFKEIDAVFNNLSPNGALITSLSHISQKKMIGKTALLKYHLPDYGTFEHSGRIIRRKKNSYALKFNNLDHEGKNKLWNYIIEKLADDNHCPYCGAKYEKRARALLRSTQLTPQSFESSQGRLPPSWFPFDIPRATIFTWQFQF